MKVVTWPTVAMSSSDRSVGLLQSADEVGRESVLRLAVAMTSQPPSPPSAVSRETKLALMAPKVVREKMISENIAIAMPVRKRFASG